MANPNIVNVTEIYGNSKSMLVTSTVAQAYIANASGSGKIYKINSLYVSNYEGTNARDITINHVIAGNSIAILSTVSVAADSVLVAITKDSSIYLMENQQIAILANVVSSLNVICSWDEIK